MGSPARLLLFIQIKNHREAVKTDETYYRIGEVSRITGISKDTLHFYDREGLLHPDHIDPENGYRYYSRLNLWQLDVITICKKLGVPLARVREIFESKDNDQVASLLLESREEALRLSRYYAQAADDILWYCRENEQLKAARQYAENFSGYEYVSCEYLPAETVIAGEQNGGDYHANLQFAAKDAFLRAGSIRRRYGYLLDISHLSENRMVKLREYVRLDEETNEGADGFPEHLPEKNRLVIPAGEYAVCRVHVDHGNADFAPLLRWLSEHGRTALAVYAEEIGLQLFPDYIDSYDCRIRAQLAEKEK